MRNFLSASLLAQLALTVTLPGLIGCEALVEIRARGESATEADKAKRDDDRNRDPDSDLLPDPQDGAGDDSDETGDGDASTGDDGSGDDGSNSDGMAGGDDGSNTDGSDGSQDSGDSIDPPPSIEPGQKVSKLWGENGEAFSAAGRLPDYSYVGYRAGEKAIPVVAIKANVKDFGAKGDGSTDDSDAIMRAYASVNGTGAVYLPEGSYRLRKILYMKKSGVVIRGAGPGKTKILIDKTLNDILGREIKDNGHEQWSAKGGFFYMGEGEFNDPTATDGDDALVHSEDLLTAIRAAAKRGDDTLSVDSTAKIKPGDMVRLMLTEASDGSLQKHMHGELLKGGEGNDGGRLVMSNFTSRVRAVSGTTVTLERFLPVDVRTAWKPKLFAFNPRVREIGIEELSIVFPDKRAAPHHMDPGANAIYLKNVANCWVRNVTIHNADNVIRTSQADYCTVTGVKVTAYSGRKNGDGYAGHHCLSITHSGDMLVTDFETQTHYRHDTDVENMNMHTVFSNGKGPNLAMGTHRSTPFATLWTNLDIGSGDHAYLGSGREDRGPRMAAYNTFWNIRGKKVGLPATSEGAMLNFVGVLGASSSPSGSKSWHVEAIKPTEIYPANLHEAQLAKRLGIK